LEPAAVHVEKQCKILLLAVEGEQLSERYSPEGIAG
jgi:hypothetical protein